LWRLLSPAERRIVVDTASGFSLKEIAHRTGTTAAATAQRISRARRRLRDLSAWFPVPAVPRLVERGRDRIATAAQGRLRAAVEGTTPVSLAAMTLTAVITIAVWPAETPGAVAGVNAIPVAVRRPLPTLTGAADAILPSLPHAVSGAVHGATATTPPPVPAPTPASHTVPAGLLSLGQSNRIAPSFTSFTASPRYGEDRTIFASARTCGSTTGCLDVLRSNDGGVTWEAPPSTGFNGGTVVLSPQYPRDMVMFGIDSGVHGPMGGLSVVQSDDGGRTFAPVSTTYTTQVVMDPAAPTGDARLVMTADFGTQLVTYHAGSHLVSPGPALPPDAGNVTGLLAASGAPDIFALTVTTTERRIYDCTAAGGCTRVPCPAQPTDACTPSTVSPTYSTDHLLLTSGTAGVELLHVPDGQWRQIPYPSGWVAYWGPFLAPNFAGSERVSVFMHESSGWSGPAALWRFDGGPFGLVARNAFDDIHNDPWTLSQLPDGRLIVASPGDASRWGISCSSDGGVNWVAGC
jgi:hypothetical protein